MNSIAIESANQLPNKSKGGGSKIPPNWFLSGTWNCDSRLITMAEEIPRRTVNFKFRTVADIITGASIKTENGLVKPPEKNNMNPNCKRSYKSTSMFWYSDKRFVLGK